MSAPFLAEPSGHEIARSPSAQLRLSNAGCGCATIYHTMLHVLRCNTILHTLLHYTILYYTILYYTILYYTILYYTILYYTILYYTILYYTILYSTILYYNYYVLLQSHPWPGLGSSGHHPRASGVCGLPQPPPPLLMPRLDRAMGGGFSHLPTHLVWYGMV